MRESRSQPFGAEGFAAFACTAADSNRCTRILNAPIGSYVSPSLASRVADSFKASFGDIVFGMEDGTVSIFGLVFGVAASTSDTRTVLVAGLTGAIAAAVSMMAGAYLDAETARDQARRHEDGVRGDVLADDAMRRALVAHGVAVEAVDELNALGRRYPQLPRALHLAYDAGDAASAASPLAHATWMFVADIIAALVPVIPFALLPMNEARYVSLGATAAVLIVLGVGRAAIGKRRVLSTTLQTLGIAAAAGGAGVIVGNLFA
jgi:VIT1/CCC1 family predicted Fe2+/Mn2+ transporter